MQGLEYYYISFGKVGGSFRQRSITLRRQYENKESVAYACGAGFLMLPMLRMYPLLLLLPLLRLLRGSE